MIVVYGALALGLTGLFFGILLALASKLFAVKTDPRIDAVREALPGANCGACGYASCVSFAEAVVHEEAPTNGCVPGQEETARAVADILKRDYIAVKPLVATVFCAGDKEKTTDLYVYDGVEDCSVVLHYHNGLKGCSYGCLGLGSCVDACPFGVITMGEHGLPVVDADACTGCGLCVKACPRDLIKILPQSDLGHLVLCSSHDRGKQVSAVCSIGCIACKACIKACPRDAIEMEEYLAVIDLEKCDDCGKCVEACRPGTIFQRTTIPDGGKKAKSVKQAASSGND